MTLAALSVSAESNCIPCTFYRAFQRQGQGQFYYRVNRTLLQNAVVAAARAAHCIWNGKKKKEMSLENEQPQKAFK